MEQTGQVNLIFALSLLLATGFAVARLAKLIRLPSVTGYIVAGIALGPAGFDVIPHPLLETRLQVFTNMALMLVAFGIGERLDLQQLRHSARVLVRTSLAESLGTFVLVAIAVLVVCRLTGVGGAEATTLWISLALVCASIAVATAPAATVAVIRELEACGPITRLVLSTVVINNALSITLFGVSAGIARVLLGTGGGTGIAEVLMPFLHTIDALLLGLVIGLLTDVIVHKLTSRGDVLVAALAAVFFCGGLASFLNLSPLLAGVAAGFAVVNRDRRDVRAFRALNDFEPPLFGIFFALAGAQLHLPELIAAGAVGGTFIVARAVGKYLGAWLGAWSAGMPSHQAATIGLGLLPQAGLAIGLAYLVQQDDTLVMIRSFVINVVVASVVINELIGPPLVRLMAVKAGEVPSGELVKPPETPRSELDGIEVVPWSWPKLQPPSNPDGFVLVGLSHPLTARGVTRIATLLSHYYRSLPFALHVVTPPAPASFWDSGADENSMALLQIATQEAQALGYRLHIEVEYAQEVAQGIIRVAESTNVQAVVLGHPLDRHVGAFRRIVDAVAREAICPVIVVKFAGPLHTERILVPITDPGDFAVVYPMVCALGMVMEHRITLLRLMPPEVRDAQLQASIQDCKAWALCHQLPADVIYRAVAAESRVHEIIQAAADHDIIVMATGTQQGLRRLFRGSLAEDVARRSPRPVLLVRGGMESRTLEELTDTSQEGTV